MQFLIAGTVGQYFAKKIYFFPDMLFCSQLSSKQFAVFRKIFQSFHAKIEEIFGNFAISRENLKNLKVKVTILELFLSYSFQPFDFPPYFCLPKYWPMWYYQDMLESVTHNVKIIKVNLVKENTIFGSIDNLLWAIFVACKLKLEMLGVKWKFCKVLVVLKKRETLDNYFFYLTPVPLWRWP